ncbi:uncharacterized protein LOC135844406 isoform X2 [Planococcus citri]|uniref:uncharacterized protein LOC135844406 isoform X2 n=1 Tax=Planococcus citri TaxID=170843 RepID=UPI0031F7CB75
MLTLTKSCWFSRQKVVMSKRPHNSDHRKQKKRRKETSFSIDKEELCRKASELLVHSRRIVTLKMIEKLITAMVTFFRDRDWMETSSSESSTNDTMESQKCSSVDQMGEDDDKKRPSNLLDEEHNSMLKKLEDYNRWLINGEEAHDLSSDDRVQLSTELCYMIRNCTDYKLLQIIAAVIMYLE